MTVRKLKHVSAGIATMLWATIAIATPALAISFPNESLTPGAVVPGSESYACRPGAASYARHTLPAALQARYETAGMTPEQRRHAADEYAYRLRQKVYALYGIPRSMHRDYRIDHRVPIELGGDPWSVQNMWPQTVAESFAKDQYENRACDEVRSGAITVEQAVRYFEGDWRRLP